MSIITENHVFIMSHSMRISPFDVHSAAFWQHVCQTLQNMNVHSGVTLYHTLMLFSTINAKKIIMQHENFQMYTLKTNII